MLVVLALISPVNAVSCRDSNQTQCTTDVKQESCVSSCNQFTSQASCVADTTCKWNEILGSSCDPQSWTRCSGDKSTDCAALASCRWEILPCGWKGECERPSCIFAADATACAKLPHCEFKTLTGSSSADCWTNSNAANDACLDQKTAATCTANNAMCEWSAQCEALGMCDYATKASCTANAGCFWSDGTGSVTFSSWLAQEALPVTPKCSPCMGGGGNRYLWTKERENKGCSVALESSISFLGTNVQISWLGSMNILSATAAASGCSGGTPARSIPTTEATANKDLDASVVKGNIDCSYEYGKAPVGKLTTSTATPFVASFGLLFGLFVCLM